MSFKEKFIELCNRKGESPSAVCVKVGITPATFSCWTDESVPRRATLMRIADYFGCSVDYLLGADEEKETPPPISDAALKAALFGDDREIPDELLQEVKRYAAYAKEKYFG